MCVRVPSTDFQPMIYVFAFSQVHGACHGVSLIPFVVVVEHQAKQSIPGTIAFTYIHVFRLQMAKPTQEFENGALFFKLLFNNLRPRRGKRKVRERFGDLNFLIESDA